MDDDRLERIRDHAKGLCISEHEHRRALGSDLIAILGEHARLSDIAGLAADLLRQADGKPAAKALRNALAGVAAGPQATPDQVLWEGETRMIMHTDTSLNGSDSFAHLPDEGFPVPPGTRVRVVAVPDHEDQP